MKQSTKVILYCLLSWAAYAFLCFKFKNCTVPWIGILVSTSIVIFDAVGLIYSFEIWKKAEQPIKRAFGFLTLSFIAITIDDAIYQPIYNILKYTHEVQVDKDIYLLSSYNIAYTIFLFLRALSLGAFLNAVYYINRKSKIFPLIISASAIFLLINIAMLATKNYNLAEFYDSTQQLLKMVNLITLTACLLLIANTGLFIMCFGYFVEMTNSGVMGLGIFGQTFNSLSLSETMFFFDSLLIVYGLYYMLNNNEYKISDFNKKKPLNWRQ